MELKGRNDTKRKDCFALTFSYAFRFKGQVVRARNDKREKTHRRDSTTNRGLESAFDNAHQ